MSVINKMPSHIKCGDLFVVNSYAKAVKPKLDGSVIFFSHALKTLSRPNGARPL